MARSSFKHFFTPDVLSSIAVDLWFRFLSRHKVDVERNGMQLPETAEGWEIDFEKLSRIINVADDVTSAELHQALYFIHEMADADSMSLLIGAIGWEALCLSENGSDSCADIAVRAWLASPDVLKRKHAEKRIANRRSYRYFFTDQEVHDPGVADMTEAQLSSIAALIGEDCDKQFKREDGAKTQVYPFTRNGELWLMVRRGEPFARKLSFKDGKSAITAYRPLGYEVAIISASNAEIRINASSNKRIEKYRQAIGDRLFGGADYFSRDNRYSLEPLRMLGRSSLSCPEVDEITEVRLTELEYFWGGTEREMELRRSNNLFTTLERRGKTVHPTVQIGKAKFEVMFRDSGKARSVVIQPQNKLVLTRDTDAHAIDTWLTLRGFVRPPQIWRVKSITGFWRSFERLPVLAGTMNEWRSATGDDADHLRHLLVPTSQHASAIVGENGVEYRVVKHGDGDFVLVDDRDGSNRPVASADLIVYEINHAALHAAISSALGIDGQPMPLADTHNAIQLGFLRPYAGYEFRTVMAYGHETENVRQTAEALIGRYGERLIVLLPTASYRSPDLDSLLTAKQCCLLTLEDMLELREDATFELTDSGEEALARFIDAALPAIGTRDESGMVAFRTPAKARWGDVKIEFKDGESVSVKVK